MGGWVGVHVCVCVGGVCVCVGVGVHVCVGVGVWVWVCVCVGVGVHVCGCVCVCGWVYMCVYMCVYARQSKFDKLKSLGPEECTHETAGVGRPTTDDIFSWLTMCFMLLVV